MDGADTRRRYNMSPPPPKRHRRQAQKTHKKILVDTETIIKPTR